MKPYDLSILMITKAEPFAMPFLKDARELATALGAQFVVGADGPSAMATLYEADLLGWFIPVQSAGYLESVHDQVLDYCKGQYVLRLDDDEKCSPAMKAWLANKEYLAGDHWKFARAHLWGNPEHRRYIINPPLFPDHQTRLSRRELAGGRDRIHCGSPYGGGREAPVLLEHWKFVVKTTDERREIVKRYDAVSPGCGTAFLAFSVPEDAITNGIVTAYLGLGEHATENEHGN